MNSQLKALVLSTLLSTVLCGCTLFSKTTGSDNLLEISKEVLDEDQGVQISIEPMGKG